MGLRFMALRLRSYRVLLLVTASASPAVHGLAQAQCVRQIASEVRESSEAGKAIGNLRQISRELSEAVNVFHKHLDEAIAQYDHGYRTGDGRRIRGADADLVTGTVDIVTVEREFMIARMLAAEGPGYAPAPLADLVQIQDLICEARGRLEASDALMRQVLVVPVTELNSKKPAESKAERDQLLKARSATEEAAKKALSVLPIDLSEIGPEEAQKDHAWDLLAMGGPAPLEPASKVRYETAQGESQEPLRPIPVRLERQKRVTLVRESGYRAALTDSGTVDPDGRHIFYQEQWVQRGQAVVRMRWRVGVDAKTGQHILIKRYSPREYRGEMDELYGSGRDYLWYLEPLEESVAPSRQEAEAALQRVARSREEIAAAIQDFKVAVRGALNRNGSELDAGLPNELRETLFAIRGHIVGAVAILEPEEKVRHAVVDAAVSIGMLEQLAAWANRITPAQDLSTAVSESEWDVLQQRSDDEIVLTQAMGRRARSLLPPESPAGTANFPALQNDMVVRVLRRRSWNEQSGTMSVLQDIWRRESLDKNARGARRTATLISIDLKTGDQTILGGSAKYYPAGPEDTVEEIFGRYAAQDLPIQVLQP